MRGTHLAARVLLLTFVAFMKTLSGSSRDVPFPKGIGSVSQLFLDRDGVLATVRLSDSATSG